MDYSDLVNGFFETTGCIFVLLNIRRVLKDKKVRGVSIWACTYFTMWGFWNFWYYSNLQQWFSLCGGALIATANLVWVSLMIWYIWKEKKMNKQAIMVYSGKMFDFWDPQPESICIEDIAHALALQNRYTGHTKEPYSVAEHCIRMSYMDVGDPLTNLLHDASEAYINDIASPQKRYLRFSVENGMGAIDTSFASQERVILEVIYKALGIYQIDHSDTRKADLIMLATEVRDLMHDNAKTQPEFVKYLKDVEPLTRKIYPWPWKLAEENYLDRFKELTNNG